MANALNKSLLIFLLSQIAYFGCLGRCGSKSSSELRNADGQALALRRSAFKLRPYETVEAKLVKGEFGSCEIPLKTADYTRLVIQSRWRKLRAVLIGPNEQKLYEYHPRSYSFLPISFIAQQSGTFLLNIYAEPPQDGEASFQVRLDQLRQQAEGDQGRVIADEAFAEAEILRDRWESAPLQEALSKYQQAQSYWQTAQDQPNLARAALEAGELRLLFSQNQQALACFEQARVAAQQSGDRKLEIDSLNEMGNAYVSLSDKKNIFDCSNKAQELSRAAGNTEGEAFALNITGLGHYQVGDISSAAACFKKSLDLCRELDHRRGAAQALINLGYVTQDLGDFHEALEYYNQGLTFWKDINDQQGQANALTACGNIYSFLGERQKALSAHHESLRLFQGFGDLQGQASALNGLGFVYDVLDEKSKALELFNQALELARASGNRDFECLTIGYIGRVYVSQGRSEDALQCFRSRLSLSRALGDKRIEARTLRDIGGVSVAQGEKIAARTYFLRALDLHRQVKDRQGQAYTLIHLGRLLETPGSRRGALKNYNQALRLMQSIEDRRGESLALYNLARLHIKMDRYDLARDRMEAAISIVESLRSKIISRELRASYLASIHQYFELYIEILMRGPRKNPARALNVAALQASESARARSLLDFLAEAKVDIREGVAPDLLERERNLQQLLAAKADLRIRALNHNPPSARAGALQVEIRSLIDQLQLVQSEIREKSPRYASLTQPSPFNLSDIRRALDPNTLLLEYFVGDSASYLWLVTTDSVATYTLAGRDAIQDLSKKFYQALTMYQPLPNESPEAYEKRVIAADAVYTQTGFRLSQELLGPVASQIANKRLVIIADDVLQYIPFSALPAPPSRQPAGRERKPESKFTPLVVDHEVVHLPSASVLATLQDEAGSRRPASRGVAIFADPVFSPTDSRIISAPDVEEDASAAAASDDLARALRSVNMNGDGVTLPRLFSTRTEAEAIMALSPQGDNLVALDFEANLGRALSPELGQFRIVHFATHSFFDDEHPELSGIVFSLVDEHRRRQDGFLQLYDIFNLRWQADLVVLSACSTALGKNVPGEGLVGLTRGFMYAGVPSVLASLWRVDDLATAHLMRSFYRGMLTNGLSVSASLRFAQAEMWKSDRWHAPYYWAGFILQGQWQK